MDDKEKEKTLMEALDYLQCRANQIKELEMLSQALVDKFYRVEKKQEDTIPPTSQEIEIGKSVIELFADISDNIEKPIHCIKINIEKIITMIG